MDILFKIFGVIGILLIAGGILSNKKIWENVIAIAGGVFLEAYSIYIGDPIFIILQLIFIGVAMYDLINDIKKEKHNVKQSTSKRPHSA